MESKHHIPLRNSIIEGITLIDWKWFCSFNSHVGVIFGKDEKTNLYHGYIGNCNILGSSEDRDIRNIITLGCRLDMHATMGFFPNRINLKGVQEQENWKT